MDRIVGSADFGRKQLLSEEHSCNFNFFDFADIKKERGEGVLSPPILCHGTKWVLRLYPFGCKKAQEGYISVYLRALLEKDGDEVKGKYTCRIKNGCWKLKWNRTFTKDNRGHGYSNFVKRSDVLETENDFLVDGTLTIQAKIQVYTDSPEPWVPKKSLSCDMLKMLNSGKSSDVKFSIGGKEFPAHFNILECRAPFLATIAENFTPNDNPIQLGADLDPNMFQMFLHFVYADELPSDVDLGADAQKLLDMADKFGCTTLKLLAESEIVKLGISIEKAADLLLYANAKNCALLEEAAMNVISANVGAVMETDGWKNLKESPMFMSQIIEMNLGRKKRKLSSKDSSDADFDNMSIAMLRKKSSELGLDVDGSREVLVNRLQNAMSSKE